MARLVVAQFRVTVFLGLSLSLFAAPAQAQPKPQTILQYFETSWSEIAARMPEIAAAGYTAIWLPPPTKGAEGEVDVGFSVFDRFDLGDKDQRGTVATRYGTFDELRFMVDEAHRFGLQVYFDTVMNHNANPALIENSGVTLDPVPIDGFPGTHPLDYHVLPARDVGNGNWEVRWPALLGGGTRVLSPDTGAGEGIVATVPMPAGTTVAGYTHLARAPWFTFNGPTIEEEQYLSLLGLIDFANEQLVDGNGPLVNDGMNLVAELPLPNYIRQPNNPEYYPNQTPVAEDTRQFLVRWIKWFGQATNCDGLRLDAIKHTPTQFFAVDFPGDDIAFNQAFQDDLDERRAWTDLNDDDGLQDALLFGESFTGDVGALLAYRRTGMYLLDFPLLFKMGEGGGIFSQRGSGDIGQLSFPQGGMDGADAEFGGLGRTAGVTFVQSHDTEAPHEQPNAAYAYTLTRVGHSVVFFDGNNFDSNSFVKPGREDALGELGSDTITTLLNSRRRFARGGMFNRYVGNDVYVYERVVTTPNGQGGATMLVAVSDATDREIRFGEFDPQPLVVTEFPPGTELVELTGHGAQPTVTVLDPSAVPTSARDAALAEYDRSSDFPVPTNYGLVYLQVPSGPDIGYVAYGPVLPDAQLNLTANGTALSVKSVETAPARRTTAGAPIPPSTIDVQEVPTGESVTVAVMTTAEAAYLRLDGGADIGGTPVSGSSEGAFDGFVFMNAVAGGFEYVIDASQLSTAVHMLTVRVETAGTPVFWSEHTAFVTEGGVVVVVPDAGSPDAMTDPDGSTPDAGTVDMGPDPDQDPDRDGVISSEDVCPDVADPEQNDFDTDGVGNACDACPETPAGATVDADGCPEVPVAKQEALRAIVELIISGGFDTVHDVNKDGVVDARDFVMRREGLLP